VRRLLIGLPLLFTLGCGPGWKVIRQASPNPMTPQTQLAVDTPTFRELRVGKQPEAQHLAGKKPEEVQRWETDKQAFASGFSSGLMAERGQLDVGGTDQLSGRYNLQSNVVYLEPGLWNGLINLPTEMRTRVVVTDAQLAPVDELEVRCVVIADLYRPAVGMRIAECGRITGAEVARYLKQRLGPK